MAEVGSVKYQVELDDSKLDNEISEAEGKFSKLGSAAGAIGKGVAVGVAAAGAAAVAGGKAMIDMANDVTKTGDEIDKMSQKIGISAEAYQEWAYVFERSGTDVNNLQTGMKTLSTVIADAANGSEGAAKKLEMVGLSIEEINGLSQEEQLSLVIGKLQEMGEGADRTAAATDLLGRSATDMAAVLNMSAEDTQALIDETHEYGMIMSDEAVKASADYQDSLTKLHGTMDGMKNSIMSAVIPSLTEMINGFSDFMNGTKSAEEVLGTALDAMVGGLGSTVPQFLAKGAELLGGLISGIGSRLPDILATMWNLLNSVALKVQESLPQFLQKGMEILSNIATGIMNNLPELISTAVEMLAKFLETVTSNLPQILAKGIEIVGKLVMGLIQAIPQIIGAIPSLVKAIIDGFMKTDWRKVGGDIIHGIISGLKAMGGALRDAIVGIAKSAFNGVLGFFGIASPSKLMRDKVGKMLPLGVAVGIEENLDPLDESVDEMNRHIIGDVNMPDVSDFANELGATISATASTQINVPVIMDGREVARATAFYTNEQLAWEAR